MSEKTVFAVLLFVICFASVTGSTFWVAPTIEDCGSHSHCNTLVRYQENNSLAFSRPHTTWVFLSGEHLLVQDNLVITDTTNVTLLSEERLCGDNVSCPPAKIVSRPSCSSQACQKGYPHQPSYCLYSWSSYISYGMFIVNSSDISLIRLQFLLQSTPLFCLQSNINESIKFALNESPINGIRIYRTHNIDLSSVSFVDERQAISIEDHTQLPNFIIDGASGLYELAGFETNFKTYVSVGSRYPAMFRPVARVTPFQPELMLDVMNSSFSSSLSVVVNSRCHESYHVVSVTFENCSFNNSDVTVDALSAARMFFTVSVTRCNFSSTDTTKSSLRVYMYYLGLPSTYLSSASVKLFWNQFVKIKTSIFFQESTVDFDALNATDNSWDVMCNNHSKQPQVKMADSVFISSAICCEMTSLSGPVVGTCLNNVTTLLTFENITFVEGSDTFCTGDNTQQFLLKGFSAFPVVFRGKNVINAKDVLLNCSTIYIYDSTSIAGNLSELFLTYNSFLYFFNNSQLVVDLITLAPYPLYFNDFVRCAVHHQTVDGVSICHSYCFFQPILHWLVGDLPCDSSNASCASASYSDEVFDERSWFFTLKVQTGEHTATNPKKIPIYNAHMETCTLDYGRKKIQLTETLLNRFVVAEGSADDHNSQELVSSPPYHICLCNQTGSMDIGHLNCENNTIVQTYRTQNLWLGVIIMGDFHRKMESFLVVRVSSNGRQLHEFRFLTKSDTCNEFISAATKLDLPLEYNLTLHSYHKYRNFRDLERSVAIFAVQVHTIDSCPLGMIQSDNSCICHPLLKKHNIECNTHDNELLFSSSLEVWMSVRDGELLVGRFCPHFFCSDEMFRGKGVPLSSLRNSSALCNVANNRIGKLCSECKPGFSAMVGSFKCSNDCSNVYIIIVIFVLSLLGIFAIGLILLLNCTIMQGDVIGILFYASSVGALHEFSPLDRVSAFLNRFVSVFALKWGFGSCVFLGMTSFARGFLQFLFPIYLFALLIIIIICAHKGNLKIFRVHFIAKRSVPALATIMLFTYNGLFTAVIYGLQFTAIYSTNSTEPEYVWLFQADLPYFQEKHLALGLLCVFFTVIYLLPLIFVILFGDLLRMCVRNLWFSHFLDVFHGAFRYPFGFWLGLRLLLKVVIITLPLSYRAIYVACWVFVIAGFLLILQLFVRPYRVDNLPQHALQDTRVAMSFTKALKWRIARLFLPSVVDSIFLGHVVIMAAITISRSSLEDTLTEVASIVVLFAAIIQIIAVTCHHICMFFPIPARAREWVERFHEKCRNCTKYLKTLKIYKWKNTDNVQLTHGLCSPLQVSYLSASMAMREDDESSGEVDSSETVSERVSEQ